MLGLNLAKEILYNLNISNTFVTQNDKEKKTTLMMIKHKNNTIQKN